MAIQSPKLYWVIAIVIWLVVAIFPSELAANTSIAAVDVSQIKSFTQLKHHLLIYRDLESEINIGEIDEVWRSGKFEDPEGEITSTGLIDYNIWGKFTLKNPSNYPVSLVLEYPDHGLAYMELFEWDQSSAGYNSHGLVSFYYPVNLREVEHPRFAFSVTLPANSSKDFYLYMGVDRSSILYLDMRVWKEKAFDVFHTREFFFYGALFGYLILVVVFTIIYVYTSKKISLLFYVGFVLSNLLAWGAVYGFLPTVFFRDGLHWRYMLMGSGLSVTFAALFTREVLTTKEFTPVLDKFLLILACYGVLPIGSSILGNSYVAVMSSQLQLFGMVLLLIAGIKRVWQGQQLAIAFVVSWGFYCVGMVSFPLRGLGVIELTMASYWITPVASIVEVGLLFSTIVVSSRNAEKDKEQARQAYVDALEQQKFTLEKTVVERTRELMNAKELAELEARTDTLTQLPNRRLFMERFNEELSRCHRQKSQLSLLVLDIDHFKSINDRFGHDTGDMVLKHFAGEVRKLIRAYDIFARIGGEEFALLMPNTAQSEASALARRICEIISQRPYLDSDYRIVVSFTGGVVEANASDLPSTMLSRADDLLYQGKHAGRNQVCVAN